MPGAASAVSPRNADSPLANVPGAQVTGRYARGRSGPDPTAQRPVIL
ncbi:hypothetical protein ACFFX0_07695 [Citricoccus parietis]|uniref:Uncharacterized protein n=1 Tax=Citricoccus parietis TaxID=592307 RepID=A0ABV5FWL8_9MICC